MTSEVTSKNGVSIRLTDERWTHITEERAELAGMRLEVLETLCQPERVLAGGESELLAVRELENSWLLCIVNWTKTALSLPLSLRAALDPWTGESSYGHNGH